MGRVWTIVFGDSSPGINIAEYQTKQVFRLPNASTGLAATPYAARAITAKVGENVTAFCVAVGPPA